MCSLQHLFVSMAVLMAGAGGGQTPAVTGGAQGDGGAWAKEREAVLGLG